MLKLWIKREIDEYTVSGIYGFFSGYYQPEWIDTDFTREVVRDIDKSEVLNSGVIDSPFLGPIPPEKLAGGTKRILCLKYFDFDNSPFMMDITGCGDNCAKWIQRISAEKDLEVRLGYPMEFLGTEYFDILIMNTGEHCSNYTEFLRAYTRAGREGH